MSDDDLELVITRREVAAKGVLRLTLSRLDGAALPSWEPGAHVDLHFRSNGIDYVRQYSLCGDVDDHFRWQIAVLLAVDGRGGSAHIHDKFAEADKIRVSVPRNNFPLKSAPRYLFIAGGIGITPMLPMIARARDRGSDWRLLYSGRSAESMAFVDKVLEFGEDRVTIRETDSDGPVDLSELIGQTDRETLIYCCGPESMIRAVDETRAATAESRVHVERFFRREPGAAGADTAFEVEFAESGIVVTIPADRSILSMAEELGIDIESSCAEGVCGSCATTVISGVPDHRDSVLSARERSGGQIMMVCVSRSCSARLVLDA